MIMLKTMIGLNGLLLRPRLGCRPTPQPHPPLSIHNQLCPNNTRSAANCDRAVCDGRAGIAGPVKGAQSDAGAAAARARSCRCFCCFCCFVDGETETDLASAIVPL
jgi:hypothetical protein